MSEAAPSAPSNGVPGSASPAGTTKVPAAAPPSPLKRVTQSAMPSGEAAKPPVPRAKTPAAANDNGGESDAQLLASLADDAAPGEPTVSIGGHDIPVSALQDLPDDVLRQIKRKIKSGDFEREVSLADALAAVPRVDHVQKRLWEAAQQEKRLEQIAQRMGSDPVGSYMALHEVDRATAIDSLSRQLVEQLERDAMPPQERAELDRRAELERKAARADEYERAEQERTLRAEEQQAAKTLRPKLEGALKQAGAPASAYTVQRLAAVVHAAMQEGVIRGAPSDADLAWAADRVATELGAERTAHLGDADGDDLIARVGEETARKIARAYAKRVSKAQPAVRREVANDNGQARARRAAGTKPTWDEFFAERDRRAGIKR